MAVWTGRGSRSCTRCLAGDIHHFPYDDDDLGDEDDDDESSI